MRFDPVLQRMENRSPTQIGLQVFAGRLHARQLHVKLPPPAWVLRANNDTANGEETVNWNCTLHLNPGTNKVTVVAKDGSGNSATNRIRIILDTSQPTITVTAPSGSQRWGNAVFTVKGTAKDNMRVAGVLCQTNGVCGLAMTGNGWTNWALDVALVPGTNVVKAYAVDGAGNQSTTSSVSLVYVVSDRLLVQATELCTMSPTTVTRCWRLISVSLPRSRQEEATHSRTG